MGLHGIAVAVVLVGTLLVRRQRQRPEVQGRTRRCSAGSPRDLATGNIRVAVLVAAPLDHLVWGVYCSASGSVGGSVINVSAMTGEQLGERIVLREQLRQLLTMEQRMLQVLVQTGVSGVVVESEFPF